LFEGYARREAKEKRNHREEPTSRSAFAKSASFLHTQKSAYASSGGQSQAPRPNGSSSQQLKTSNSG
jgi:hypothetical protein